MADFGKAWSKLLRAEGGYSNDPVDPGAETIFGISRRSHPLWDGWPLLDEFKATRLVIPSAAKVEEDFPWTAEHDQELRERARVYYKERFWNKVAGSEIPDQGLAEVLFDGAVNMGVFGISTSFQRALNALNRDGAAYPMTKADGDIGPDTLRTYARYLMYEWSGARAGEDDRALAVRVKALPTESVEKASSVVVGIIRGLRVSRYIEITERDPSLRRFLRGWLRRCF